MKLTRIIISLVAALLAVACGSRDSFKVSGEIQGGSSALVELLYCPDGAAKRVSARAVDGKFVIEGQSRQPALGFISVGGSGAVAVVVVKNGDNLECRLDAGNPYASVIKGTEANERLNEFIRSNADVLAEGNPVKINALVADFVGKNRSSEAAMAALVNPYRSDCNEIGADSLVGCIDPEARPAAMVLNFTSALSAQLSSDARADIIGMSLVNRNDSVERYNPYRHTLTLLAFVADEKAQRDTVVPVLRRLRGDFAERRLAVLEVSAAADSAAWKSSTATDSATWTQTWTPGTVSSQQYRRMSVARVPFFIVADSTGRQLYRGGSAAGAERVLRDSFKSR